MAVTISNYFSNAIVGQPMAGSDYNIHDSDSSPKYAIGTRFVRSDGNTYVYCHFGASAANGCIMTTDRSESSISGVNAFTAPATAGKPPFENINMGAIGSHYIQGNLTISENQLAGGYLTGYGGPAAGTTYRIRGNTSWNGSTTRIELYEPLIQAVSAASDILCVGSPYANLEPCLTGAGGAIGADTVPVGVVTRSHTAVAYGWVCTKGITTVRVQGKVTAGMPLMMSGVGGSVDVANEANGTMTTGGKITQRTVGFATDSLDALPTAKVNFE